MISRRGLLQASLAILTPAAVRAQALGQVPVNAALRPLDPTVLPRGIRSRFVDDVNGIRMHVLECGYEAADRPGVLMLHGFPELAYSWRKVMPALAAAGFHVMAPDVRGYGRSGGADATYDDDLRPFQSLNKVRDMLALVFAFGHQSVAVVGHDQGSPLAGWCALAHPDVFRSVVMMSAPFGGAPSPPSGMANATSRSSASPDPDRIYEELAALTPPRQHYQRYCATRGANENLWHPPQGIHVPARLLPHEKRGLETEPAASVGGENRGGVGEATSVLRDGSRQRHGGDRRARDALTGRDRRESLAARRRTPRVQRGVRAHGLSRRIELLPHGWCGPGSANLFRQKH